MCVDLRATVYGRTAHLSIQRKKKKETENTGTRDTIPSLSPTIVRKRMNEILKVYCKLRYLSLSLSLSLSEVHGSHTDGRTLGQTV